MLHECLKIKTFCLYYNGSDPQFGTKICFATRRHVEYLHLTSPESLPIFPFNHASLVQLCTTDCTFMPNGIVNWRCLTALVIRRGKLTDQAMEYILSGSPSLKSLELWQERFDKLVIASKSLKSLCLHDIHFSTIDISCPSLEKLSVCSDIWAQVIENVISSSSLLESVYLYIPTSLQLPKLVITSKSLKRLALSDIREFGALEISCPKLEKLKLFDCLRFQTAQLVNLPSSLCATIHSYDYHKDGFEYIHMIKALMESLGSIKQLKFGYGFIKLLSDIAIKEGHCRLVPRLNIKCLIMYVSSLNECYHETACIIHNSNALEELIIKAHKYEDYDYPEKLNEFGENYWNSNTTVFHCLESHLKTIKIIGFPCRDHNRKLLLKFVQFLLNNARVLEKMVVELKDRDGETSCISQELLSMSRYSQSAKIELRRS